MKLEFKKPTDGQYDISGLLKEYWSYHKIYFDRSKITTSYNSLYGFWDIHVKRGPLYKAGYGHGTPKQQTTNWENYLKDLTELHKDARFYHDSWTWEPILDNVHIADTDLICNSNVHCPQIRIWINAV